MRASGWLVARSTQGGFPQMFLAHIKAEHEIQLVRRSVVRFIHPSYNSHQKKNHVKAHLTFNIIKLYIEMGRLRGFMTQNGV